MLDFKKGKKRINFVTSTDAQTGSTRLRVYKIAEWLNANGYSATINSDEDADIYVFQKSSPQFLIPRFIEAKKRNKITVFDIDDYHESCFDPIIKNVDLLFVGSKRLQSLYASRNRNIVFLPNMIDIKDFDMPQTDYDLKRLNLVWFGNTPNLPALEATQIENVTKITQGGDLEWRLDTIDETLQQFDLVLIPQHDTDGGQSKSNCRMLKCIYLGIPVLVSSIESYLDFAEEIDYPHEFILDDLSKWKSTIEAIQSGEIKLEFDFQRARQIIHEKYGQATICTMYLNEVLNTKHQMSCFRRFLFKWKHSQMRQKLSKRLKK